MVALLKKHGAQPSPANIVMAERVYNRGMSAALLAVDRRWSGIFSEDAEFVKATMTAAMCAEPVNRYNAELVDRCGNKTVDRCEDVSGEELCIAEKASVEPVSIIALASRLSEERKALSQWTEKQHDRSDP